jgi:hypothetical protein
MSDEDMSPLEMWKRALTHPTVQANPGAKQYIQDQVDLMQRELPPAAEDEAKSSGKL